jgi:nucleotide-binding universal stress UspA family protein
MFDRIVVPLDGTGFAEAALVPACELARVFHARILLIQSIGAAAYPMVMPASDEDAEAVWERMDDADAYLHDMQTRLQADGYAAEMALAIARPGTGIARAAAWEKADLIVMATHLRRGVEPVMGGPSTTLKVLAGTHVPILAWHVSETQEVDDESDAGGRGRLLKGPDFPIIVPLDGSAFAEGALPTAEALARALGQRLVLVQAIERAEDEEGARAYLKRVKDEIEARGIRVDMLVREGMPLGVIKATRREHKANLIVLASHGRGRKTDSLLGSVAASIIAEEEAPILVIQPEADGGRWPHHVVMSAADTQTDQNSL